MKRRTHKTTIYFPCPDCNGTGYIPKRNIPDDSTILVDKSYTAVDPDIYHEMCSLCEGSGLGHIREIRFTEDVTELALEEKMSG